MTVSEPKCPRTVFDSGLVLETIVLLISILTSTLFLGVAIALEDSSPLPGFEISASPASAPADGVTWATSTVVINPLNGFNGSVVLSMTQLPEGLTCLPFNHAAITPSGISSLSCSSETARTYSVTIIGTSDVGSNSTVGKFVFTPLTHLKPDFSMDIVPPALTIQTGESGTATISISSINGFSSILFLNATVFPSGPAILLNSSIITNDSSVSTLTVNVANTASTGSYIITITAMGGGFTHSEQVNLSVIAIATPTSQEPATPTNSSLTLGYAIVVTLTITSVIFAIVLWNRSNSSKLRTSPDPFDILRAH